MSRRGYNGRADDGQNSQDGLSAASTRSPPHVHGEEWEFHLALGDQTIAALVCPRPWMAVCVEPRSPEPLAALVVREHQQTEDAHVVGWGSLLFDELPADQVRQPP